jgi:hypothetical protein
MQSGFVGGKAADMEQLRANPIELDIRHRETVKRPVVREKMNESEVTFDRRIVTSGEKMGKEIVRGILRRRHRDTDRLATA